MRIRTATPDDAASIRLIYSTYIEASAITFHTQVLGVDQYREQIQESLRMYPWYVAEQDGEILGYAYGSEHHPRQAYRWSVNVSIYLQEEYQGKGTGRQLYEKLLATLRRQGFRMVHAGITLPNEPSQKIHEAFGFSYVGTFPAAGFKLGIWKDVGWWVLDLMQGLAPNQAAPEPIPFSELTPDQPKSRK